MPNRGRRSAVGCCSPAPLRLFECVCTRVTFSFTSTSTFRILFSFFNDTATTEIYTLSLHDALPILFHLPVRDASGTMHAKFFHGAYLQDRLKEGQRLVLHGKAEYDFYRPTRLEMINPEIELLGNDDAAADSTEVGRIVPIYEAIAGITSRMLRRIIYGLLGILERDIPDPLPKEIRERYRFPSRREALLYAHFPPKDEDIEKLNSFRSPAHMRLIFEEFFAYQLAMALRKASDHRQI